jgi:hypothetical protein
MKKRGSSETSDGSGSESLIVQEELVVYGDSMQRPPSAWLRPYHEPQGGVASVTLFVFAERPLDLRVPFSRSQHGLPAEFDFDALDIRQHVRADTPDWFDGFFRKEMRRIARDDLGDAAERLDELEAAYSIGVELEEPSELGYLQACWATATWLCDAGALFVHDPHAIKWHEARSVLALDPLREFDLEHEVTLVFETDGTPGFGNVTHTRGLAKFGRPDVLLFGAEPEDARATAGLLNALALRAALGAPLRANQIVRPANLEPRSLVPYEPGALHPEVNLNNAGLVLDIGGWGLRNLATP